MTTLVETASPEETMAVGRCLGAALRPGDLVALEGDLGSGKTVLVRGVAQALLVDDPVHSPTFVLHHRYRGPVPLDHYDLYRLQGLGWADAGLDEPAPAIHPSSAAFNPCWTAPGAPGATWRRSRPAAGLDRSPACGWGWRSPQGSPMRAACRSTWWTASRCSGPNRR